MTRLMFSRTYRPTKDGKDPMIFKIKTMLQDEGLIDKLNFVGEISNVSPSTLVNWFDGDTISPIQRTTGSVITAIGYKIDVVKERDIDLKQELKRAAEWVARQNSVSKTKLAAARKRLNGRK